MLEPSLAQQNSHKRLICIICQWEVGYLACVTLLINPTFVWVSHKVSGTAPKDLRSNIISQTKVCEHSIQKFFTAVSPKYVFSTNKQTESETICYTFCIIKKPSAVLWSAVTTGSSVNITLQYPYTEKEWKVMNSASNNSNPISISTMDMY